MVKTESRFDVERVRKLGDARYGPRHVDRAAWAREVGISLPTLLAFLDGSPSVKIGNVDKILEPFGLTFTDVIKKKKAS